MVDVKNTIIISDMPIIPLIPSISMELEEVDSGVEGIVMLPISILAKDSEAVVMSVVVVVFESTRVDDESGRRVMRQRT